MDSHKPGKSASSDSQATIDKEAAGTPKAKHSAEKPLRGQAGKHPSQLSPVPEYLTDRYRLVTPYTRL
jgi:hypothetical protein